MIDQVTFRAVGNFYTIKARFFSVDLRLVGNRSQLLLISLTVNSRGHGYGFLPSA